MITIVKSPHAVEIPFDNSANGFVSDTVQEAIEEAFQEAGIFGSKVYKEEDSAETSTTSTTIWSTKLTISPLSLPTGNYIIHFSCIHRTSAANRETDIRIFDGTNSLWEIRSSIIRTQGLQVISGFLFQNNISGNKTYSLQFKVGGTATTSFCKNASIIFYRIS